MQNFDISGKKVMFDNEEQVINMGGPYIGTLSIDDKLISDNCIVDNLVFDETKQRVYFVKYHSTSKWMSGTFFTINFHDFRQDMVYQYVKTFKTLYLSGLCGDNEMEIFNAFHSQIVKYKSIFSLGTEKYV
jgi:hypothetical protein